MKEIWVFNGSMARFPSGLFVSLDNAKEWIKDNKLSGVLTKYPINTGVYDWSIENGFFTPQDEKHKLPSFIASFTCASLDHFHFENGEED
ncbi:hypothetical protein [Rahnella laticis]|uniref:DUF7710 domain-containing protein n=1 Tax=Rahnella laticis TaxID=2787622 RepID=UPI0018A24CAE|nr:hypothetical protein [Rahnella laticis]MBF7994834.1 hypothetical protein [Rahnella laticis]